METKGGTMRLEVISGKFSICSIDQMVEIDWTSPYTFVSKMEEECSLICFSKKVPKQVLREDAGWRAFFITDIEDTKTEQYLHRISEILAENQIAIHVATTFRSDYVFVPEDKLEQALYVLSKRGYIINRKK